MPHARFQNYSTSGSAEDFKGFYHIWVWRPSWLYELDHLYKLSFTRRMHMKFAFDLPSGFGEDLCKRRRTNGRHSMNILYAHLVSLVALVS